MKEYTEWQLEIHRRNQAIHDIMLNKRDVHGAQEEAGKLVSAAVGLFNSLVRNDGGSLCGRYWEPKTVTVTDVAEEDEQKPAG